MEEELFLLRELLLLRTEDRVRLTFQCYSNVKLTFDPETLNKTKKKERNENPISS